MNFRDQHKQSLMRLRVTNPTRDMSEGELRIWWEEHLDAVKAIDPADLEAARPKLRDKHKWFPDIPEILAECRKVRENRIAPTREQLIHDQQKLLAPPENDWTPEKLAAARKTIKPGSATGVLLSKFLDSVEVNE
jgi:hypothetical protein